MNQVPAALRGSYTGKKFKAVVCTEMTIPMDAGLWSGGSRAEYSAINLENGKSMPFQGSNLAPWDGGRRDHKVTIVPGMAVVLHSMFCGKDMGLTFYIHPDNATKMLPAPVELSKEEKVVLTTIRSYKAAYRQQMAQGQGISGTQYAAILQSLTEKGMLHKGNRITTKGKNAIGDSY